MNRKRAASIGKKINPNFWIFCEGETEEAYVSYLRSLYRIPITIVPKIVGNRITERFIKSYKKGKPVHEKDRDFLMYDADIPEILEPLKSIKSALLLASSPSIELWFLLHYKNQTSSITTKECIKELENRNRNTYRKGVIDGRLEARLSDHCQDACKRTKSLTLYNNPSSNIFELIELLEGIRKTPK
jgi:hypothetical protein